ncbi:hypothetical protein GGH94_002640 [Coemansia aciculifera]|uniref:Uncharacterized protein n=1 Tax=Coemansia aciculifera TaxID=417176 RepID=A0A9W8IIZ2_9FUNG|nr:hypothetical protein GGH94_002640 [Coemansia aciculifera]
MTDGTTFIESAWALDIDSWTRVACIGLCLVSILFATRTLSGYHRYFNSDSPAIELPTMFLLPWLGTCDILTAVASLIQLLQSSSTAGGMLAESSMDMARRVVLAAQICYFLLHIMLAVHTMSVAGVLNPILDRSMGGYYGPAAGALSYIATHRLLTTIPVYSAFYYTLLPLATLAVVFAAAVLVPKAARVKGIRATVFIGEDEDVEATVSLDDYAAFAKAIAALCLLWHLPWLVWCHTPGQASWTPALIFLPLCARGIYSFVVLRISPAMGIHVVDAEHAHQD